jgi:hypothetical protein
MHQERAGSAKSKTTMVLRDQKCFQAQTYKQPQEKPYFVVILIYIYIY